MVSAITLAKLGGVGLALGLAYVALKNAGAIGEAVGDTVGGGFASGLKCITDFFSAAVDIFKSTEDALTNTSAQQVANTLDLKNAVNIPDPASQTFAGDVENRKTSESLALAGLLESSGSDVKVDVSNRELFLEDKFVQPLDFAFDDAGFLKTGTSGVGDATLKSQAELSKKFGIVTFDQKGSISTVGGLVSSL